MRLTSISGPALSQVELPLWPPILATRGAGSRSALHAHHAMHLVLCLDGTLRARTRSTARWAFAAGVLTAPNVLHAIDAEGIEILLVFFDPQSDAGESLLPALQEPVRLLSSRERDALVRNAQPEKIMSTDGIEWTRRVVATLGRAPVASRRSVHPRVRKLLRILRTMPADEDRSLVALARAVGLSPSRLMHSFTTSIGIPLRPYLAWLKFQRAAGAIVTGTPLGRAAHAAGFADAAHMARTFRRMFGVSPSSLRQRLTHQPVGSSAPTA